MPTPPSTTTDFKTVFKEWDWYLISMHFLPVVGLLVASLGVAAYKLQFFIIYPSSFPQGSRTQVDTPDMYGMEYTEDDLLTSDGELVKVYTVPSKTPSNLTVVFLGPNAGNMGMGLPMVAKVHEMGYNGVCLSYRGYGKSSGSPSEAGLKKDVVACIQHTKTRFPHSKIVLYGRSLGGAVAIYAASQIEVEAIILENTFTSIPEVAPNVLPIPKALANLAITQKWESYKLIPQIKVPVLFQAGGKDELIPPPMFRRMYELCGSLDKAYKLYPEGMHNDTVIQRGYWDEIEAFLKHVS